MLDYDLAKLYEVETKRIKRSHVGMIKRAEVNTPVDTLFNIAKKLKIDMKELFEK